MTIEDLSQSEGMWYSSNANKQDIVLKSSIRFFRNVKGYLFSHKLNREDRENLNEIIIDNISKTHYINNLSIFDLSNISNNDKNILFERNIIRNKKENRGVIIISSNQNYYFIINSDEHVEYVITKPGLQIDSLFAEGRKVIFDIGNTIDFSYMPEFGYIMANPYYSGSAIEIFVTLHLPGLIFSSKINELLANIEKKVLGLRSSWIEGYYEVYNKRSSGLEEIDIYENIIDNISYIIDYENKTRENIYKKNKSMIKDKVWRSYGILLSSRMISLFEALELLSNLRLGISLGIMNYLRIKDINLLLYFIQDFHLRKRYIIGDGDSLEELRAHFIREYLKEVI